MLNKLEKFEIIDAANDWNFFRKLRNTLIHKSPDTEKGYWKESKKPCTFIIKSDLFIKKPREN